jgi:uncharacterized protein
MSEFVIIALIVSGLFVGFINTLAGGGTIISLSLFMFLGLPANVANGTNRIAVVFQNIVGVYNFRKNGMLKTEKAWKMAVPVIIGSVVGAKIAANLNEGFIEIAIAIAMIIMLFFLLVKPGNWLKGNEILQNRPMNIQTYVLYFIIGVYAGFIHLGTGYFLLATLVLNCGYDLIRANALKNLIVLLYVPFTLIVFVLQDQVVWKYGLIHAIGNIIGAHIASRYAIKWGTNFVRWVIMIVIILSVADLLNVIDIRTMIRGIMENTQ